MHTIKFHYLPQQDGHIPNACGEWLLALLIPDIAQELSGKLLVDSWKSVLSSVSFTGVDVDSATGDKPTYLASLKWSWHTCMKCPVLVMSKVGGENVTAAVFHCFVGQLLKVGQKVKLGSGEELMLVLHQKQKCSVFLLLSGLCLLSSNQQALPQGMAPVVHSTENSTAIARWISFSSALACSQAGGKFSCLWWGEESRRCLD